MRRATVIHWRPDEAAAAMDRIREAGWNAECLRPEGGNLRPLREHPPQAFIIDLTRLPSHGREVGQALRRFAATRHIPLVFAGGDPDKVEKTRAVLPDAVFCDWEGIVAALHEALAAAPEEPVVPQPMAGYSGRPLAKKLGVAADTPVCLMGAPQGFETKLEVPALRVRKGAVRVLWFVRSQQQMMAGFARATAAVGDKGGLWVIWPKKTSGIETDVSETVIRAFCMQRGWVDYKICAVDETWSGLLFARKRK